VVVCDRYYDSTLAYQGMARGIDEAAIRAQIAFATFGLAPHVTFLIDLDPAVGLARINPAHADRLEREGLEFHRRVREGFLQVAKEEPRRYIVLNGQVHRRASRRYLAHCGTKTWNTDENYKRIMTLLAIIILVVQLLGASRVTDRNKVVMMRSCKHPSGAL
jgi:thymidylate kinase